MTEGPPQGGPLRIIVAPREGVSRRAGNSRCYDLSFRRRTEAINSNRILLQKM